MNDNSFSVQVSDYIELHASTGPINPFAILEAGPWACALQGLAKSNGHSYSTFQRGQFFFMKIGFFVFPTIFWLAEMPYVLFTQYLLNLFILYLVFHSLSPRLLMTLIILIKG